MDKVKKRLSNWTLKSLDFPRCLVLLNLVLQAMPTYMFSTMLAHKSILRDLRNIQWKFLWSGTQDSHKWALVNWDIVCKPNSQGGLGLRDHDVMSEIQGAKVWRRWVNHTSDPWAKLWHIKYARYRPIQKFIRFNESLSDSPIGLKALVGKNIVQDHSFWEIRDGRRENFWDDSWNQLPILGRDPRWLQIKDKAIKEGNIQVNQSWMIGNHMEQC